VTRTLIKVCGVTTVGDAAMVVAAGVDFLGLNFWSGSKRRVDVATAHELAAAGRAAGPVTLVGLFVDADADDIAITAAAVGLDAVQIHGEDDPAVLAAIARTGVAVWKAVAVAGAADIDGIAALVQSPVTTVLLDAPSPGRGGSGQRFDWALARRAVERYPRHQIALAGGLTADNVGAAIAAVRPWAVDVASGVERAPGIKDPDRVRAFVAAVATAQRVSEEHLS
jgi:phosphoribosylanthranilate isomerase